ncbi:MAG: hypothetical protein H6817_10565 [Phycisphaerales bacterium]|nr:hypothetical protein [Phycisphaerales bacterium]
MTHSPFDIYRLVLVIFAVVYLCTLLVSTLWSLRRQPVWMSRNATFVAGLLSRARVYRRDLLEVAGLVALLTVLVVVQL